MIISTVFLLASCGEKNVKLNEVQSIPNETWDASEPLKFSFEIEDTNQVFDFFLTVRNSKAYEWSNLYMFVEIESPNKLVNVDTVEVLLADKTGKWYGEVSGSLVTTEQPLIHHKRFPIVGTYSLLFNQAMRANELEGISDIGLKIKKVINE